jgi:hypothetical protein
MLSRVDRGGGGGLTGLPQSKQKAEFSGSSALQLEHFMMISFGVQDYDIRKPQRLQNFFPTGS